MAPRKPTSEPDKIFKKSRPIGGKRRGRPPKNSPTPEQLSDSPAQQLSDASKQPSLTVVASPGAASSSRLYRPYTGISQVSHGLSLPSFDVNSYFASDLFSDFSPLPRTTKEKADELVSSVEEKRQTIRVITANIGLNQDVIRAGNEYLKLEGLAIDYATTSVNNETKYIGYQTAEVNRDIAVNRFDQAQERLVQGQRTLAGMQSITPLIDEEWQARKSLKQSQIRSLEIEATKAKEALEPKLLQLSQNFRQELEELN